MTSDKLVVEFCRELEQCMVRLYVAPVRRNPAEKLTRSLVTDSFNAVNNVIEQLGYDAVSRLRQGRERAY